MYCWGVGGDESFVNDGVMEVDGFVMYIYINVSTKRLSQENECG